MTVAIGSTLKGRYRLDAVLGKGGMGEVYAAVDLQTGAEVAIKVVSRAYFTDTLMARLYREAEAARRIQSELVPALYEVDHTDGGELFLVMERLFGEPLSHRVKARVALDWPEVAGYGEDMLRALIDAHTAGIVHRDLKPGNVFLTRPLLGGEGTRERAKILDFGVCKIDGTDEEHLTATGEALGTIAYMAPEQIRGAAKVDERADLYSFGLVVFEMVAGRLPFDAQGQVALIASKLERSARKLGDLAVVPVPAGLEALLAKALARKPQDRFQSAQEMLRAWRALGPAVVAPRAHPSMAPSFSTGTQTAMSAGTLTREAGGGASTRLWLTVAAAAALLGIAGLVGVVVVKKRAAAEPEVDPPGVTAVSTPVIVTPASPTSPPSSTGPTSPATAVAAAPTDPPPPSDPAVDIELVTPPGASAGAPTVARPGGRPGAKPPAPSAKPVASGKPTKGKPGATIAAEPRY